MSIQKLVMVSTHNQLDASPGYYSGRGATLSDLNSEMLNQIADGIKKEHGDQAHDNYVKMVWGMPSLSATAFLNNLFSLERAGWDISKASLKNNGNSFESEGEALGLLGNVLSQMRTKQTDQTELIRKDFRKMN